MSSSLYETKAAKSRSTSYRIHTSYLPFTYCNRRRTPLSLYTSSTFPIVMDNNSNRHHQQNQQQYSHHDHDDYRRHRRRVDGSIIGSNYSGRSSSSSSSSNNNKSSISTNTTGTTNDDRSPSMLVQGLRQFHSVLGHTKTRQTSTSASASSCLPAFSHPPPLGPPNIAMLGRSPSFSSKSRPSRPSSMPISTLSISTPVPVPAPASASAGIRSSVGAGGGAVGLELGVLSSSAPASFIISGTSSFSNNKYSSSLANRDSKRSTDDCDDDDDDAADEPILRLVQHLQQQEQEETKPLPLPLPLPQQSSFNDNITSYSRNRSSGSSSAYNFNDNTNNKRRHSRIIGDTSSGQQQQQINDGTKPVLSLWGNNLEPIPIDHVPFAPYRIIDIGDQTRDDQQDQQLQQQHNQRYHHQRRQQRRRHQVAETPEYTIGTRGSIRNIVDADTAIHRPQIQEIMSQHAAQVQQQQAHLHDPFYFTNQFSQQNNNARKTNMGNSPVLAPTPTLALSQTNVHLNQPHRATTTSENLHNDDNIDKNSKINALKREERQQFLVFVYILFKLIDDACKEPSKETPMTKKNPSSSSSLSDESTISSVSTGRRRIVLDNDERLGQKRGEETGGGGVALEIAKNKEIRVHAKRLVKECTTGCRLGMEEYEPLMDVLKMKLQTVDGIDVYWEKAQSHLDSFWSKRKRKELLQHPEQEKYQEQEQVDQGHVQGHVQQQEAANYGKRMRYDRFDSGGRNNTIIDDGKEQNSDGRSNEESFRQGKKCISDEGDDEETYIVGV